MPLAAHTCHRGLQMYRSMAGEAQALLAGILNNLESMLEVLVQDGFAPLESAYLKAWLHSGQQVIHCPLSCAAGSCTAALL